MAVILNNEHFSQGPAKAGADWAANLNTGIGSLVQAKMGKIAQQHQQSQTASALRALGFPADKVNDLSKLDPNLLLKHFEPAMMGGQQGQGFGMPGSEAQAGQGILGSKEAALMREQSKQKQKEMFSLEKAQKPYYEQSIKDYTGSRDSLKDLNRLEGLINKGDIVNPSEDHIQRYLSKVFKINLKDLRGADTEEFEKINAGFIKNAKNWFGSRVTNYDLQSFLKTLPTLSTSHEGKLRLIGSMRAAAEAQQIRYKEFRNLMKENGGRIPPYAQAEVEERIAPQLDALEKAFVSGSYHPKLSEKAKKGAERNWLIRPVKAALTSVAAPLNAAADLAGGVAKSYAGARHGGF